MFKARAYETQIAIPRLPDSDFLGLLPNLRTWNFKISVTSMLNAEKGEMVTEVRSWKEYSADNAN